MQTRPIFSLSLLSLFNFYLLRAPRVRASRQTERVAHSLFHPVSKFLLYLCFFAFNLCLFNPYLALLAQQESPEVKEGPDPALIRNLEGELAQSSPDYAQIEKQARTALERYYSQLTQGKSIAYERQNQSKDYSKLSKNALRLLSQLGDKSIGRSYFLGEKADLFRLHVILAKSYAGRENPTKALSEYAMAFRYANIEPPSLEEQRILQKLRAELDLQDDKKAAAASEEGNAVNDAAKDILSQEESQAQIQNKITDTQKEESYLWMKKSFGNPERFAFAKTENPQSQSEARRFAAEFRRHQKLKKEYKKAKGLAALTRVKEARGENIELSLSNAREQREALKEQLEQSKASLENIRRGAYKSYVEKRREFYGDAAYQMALAVKRLDQAKHAFTTLSKGSSYLRGQGGTGFFGR